MSDNSRERLTRLLRLSPLVEKPISFVEFLTELAEHPERADSASAVLFNAVTAMGVEDPEKEPNPERRQYLKMLKELNIPSLVAFRHVGGNQRFALLPMGFLKSAAAGGAQRKQMIIIDGGPGSGKDYFKDGFVKALEYYTDEVQRLYAVEGCPHAENPVNLLKLLKADQLKELSEELSIPLDQLKKMVDLACEPCQHCYSKLMGTVQSPKEEPSFDEVNVVKMRLSSRSNGVADWQPGGTVSLASALNKANRGFISLPDAFIERSTREGETDERLLLLDATEYRRLPGVVSEDGTVTAASPLDVIILASTNKRALKSFLDDVVPDKDAFTSRSAIYRLPYNTVRVEEVRSYEAALAQYKERAHFDPLVLKVIATLAVLSRLAKPKEHGPFAHPLDILRLYQGDSYQPKVRPESEFSSVWEPRSSSYGSSSYGSGYGSRSGYGSTSSSSSKDDGEEKLPKMPTDVPLSAGLLFQFADKTEGQNGLDMRTMLSLLSSINQAGLMKPSEHKCVNSLEVLRLLRGWIARKAKQTDDNTEEQQAVYDRCLKWLGGPPMPGESAPADKPELIEAEFRRMLRDMLLRVFAPDYAERAQKLFTDYRLHAPAAFEGKPTVKDPQMGQVPVNVGLCDELDRYRLGKDKGAVLSDEDKRFRGQLDALIGVLRDEFIEQFGEDKAKEFKVDWETIPELAQAIRNKLDAEIGQLMEKLMATEVKSDLDAFQQQQLERAEKALTELGFCPACRKPVLEYAKRTKIWSFKLN